MARQPQKRVMRRRHMQTQGSDMPVFETLQKNISGFAMMALVAGSATLVQAQEAPPEQAPDDGLALGEEVPEGEVQVGDTYVVEINGDWTVRCLKTDGDQDPCEMYQLLSDEEGTPISEIVLFELPDGRAARAGATIIVPLETSLQQQLTIQVDDTAARRYPFAFCNSVGCYARIGLTQEELDAYRRGAAAQLSIVPFRAQDQQVSVTMSLNGFTASYDKVAELNGT
jgi:invasion protein IalB